MSDLKIWTVSFNDGGWHQERPKEIVVAKDKEEAIKLATDKRPGYESWDKWATEFTIEGFVIEIYDEKTYKRDKSLEKVVGK